MVSRLQLFPNLLNVIEKHFLVLFFFLNRRLVVEPLILIKVVLDESPELIAEFIDLLFSPSNYFHMRTSNRYRVM